MISVCTFNYVFFYVTCWLVFKLFSFNPSLVHLTETAYVFLGLDLDKTFALPSEYPSFFLS